MFSATSGSVTLSGSSEATAPVITMTGVIHEAYAAHRLVNEYGFGDFDVIPGERDARVCSFRQCALRFSESFRSGP